MKFPDDVVERVRMAVRSAILNTDGRFVADMALEVLTAEDLVRALGQDAIVKAAGNGLVEMHAALKERADLDAAHRLKEMAAQHRMGQAARAATVEDAIRAGVPELVRTPEHWDFDPSTGVKSKPVKPETLAFLLALAATFALPLVLR